MLYVVIFLTGDTHGDLKRFNSSNFSEGKELTKEDTVIQLGDFGVIWNYLELSNEEYWMKWLGQKPWSTLVIPGNHENHEVIESLPQEEKWGAKVRVYEIQKEKIYFGIPGEIYTIENKSFLCVPKAMSTDKEFRTEGKTWWANELLSKEEENNILNSLDKINWKVDYVLSHTCPQSIIPYLIEEAYSKIYDPTSKFLEFISERLEFKAWFFGHFHIDEYIKDSCEDNYYCLYKGMDSLENILDGYK